MPKIFLAGHNGMVGSAILRKLSTKDIYGEDNLVLTARSSDLDLTRQSDVERFMGVHRPEIIIIAAAKVGGIVANNSFPADFIYQNLMIQANIINAAHVSGVKRLLQLGSSCIYPRNSSQPIKENYLLTGSLEPTNEPYAVAKIAGIKLCESYNRQFGSDFRSVMPTNLYGPGDNYHSSNSHVVPALIKKFHEAKSNEIASVEVWGTGRPRREFLHVDDMADASLYVLNLDKEIYDSVTQPMESHINVGYGEDISIAELAALVAKTVGYTNEIIYNESMPDGSPQKLMDSSKINHLGWHPKIDLESGLHSAYDWYLQNISQVRSK